MNRIERIANRAKAQGSHISRPLPVRDGLADKAAALQEAANAFFRGEGNWA